MSLKQHGPRIGLLIVLAGVLLGWLAAHTEVLFADGLRYVRQAQTLDQGVVDRGHCSGRRSSGLSARDRPGASADRRGGPRVVAGRRAGGLDRRGALARRAPVPGRARALRRRLGVAGLRC